MSLNIAMLSPELKSVTRTSPLATATPTGGTAGVP